MLNSPFPKLNSEEGVDDDGMREKHIDLRDDCGESLLILLRIAHCQFSMLPSAMEFETILKIAILCDKYDCVGLVKPWLEQCLVNEQSECDKPGHEEWLFIAWVFGRGNIFPGLARKLLREMTVNDDGKSLTSTGEAFPSLMPPGMIDNLISMRHVKDLLRVTYDFLDLFLNYGFTSCCQPSSQKACNALMCGSLVIGLQELGLWPQNSPDDINLSVQDLASKLASLVIWTYPANNCTNHYNCGSASLSDRVTSTLQSIPDPVLESHRRHVQAQGMK